MHPLEFCFLGELFCIICFKHCGGKHDKISSSVCYRGSESELGRGTSSAESPSKQDPKACHAQINVLGGLGRDGENAFLEAETIPLFQPMLSSAMAMLSFTTAPYSSKCTQLFLCMPAHTRNTQAAERGCTERNCSR